MKKQNVKRQKKKDYRIWLAYLVLVLFLIFVGMVLCYRLTYHSPTEVYQNHTSLELVWDGTSYKGNYSGDFSNAQPNGIGTFVSKDGAFQYEGQWEKGVFSGEGKITYEDGTIEEGNFQKGKRDGRVRLHSSGDTYVETIYDEGVPYVKSDTYKDGKITETEFYINATKMSDIIQDALPLTQEILEKKSYYDHYVYVEGEIVSVVQDDEKCYFRLDSDTAGMIFGSFENTLGTRSRQVFMPNLQKGDKIRIYGYYTGKKKDNILDDEEGHGTAYLSIDPYLGIMEDFDISQTLELSYEEISKQPYFYYMQPVRQTYVIQDVLSLGKNYYLKATLKGADRDIYVLCYEREVDSVFVTGTEITVTGYYEGQYKMKKPKNQEENGGDKSLEVEYDYEIYPAVRVNEIR